MITTPVAMDTYDVVIAGGGMAGLSLALALRLGGGTGLRVLVCDPQAGQEAGQGRLPDGRVCAIAEGPRRMLEALGVWSQLADEATLVQHMRISDSLVPESVRLPLLDFAAQVPDAPLAHIIHNHALERALDAAAQEAGVDYRAARVRAMETGARARIVRLDNGETIAAKLVVGADGAASSLRALAGIATAGRDYPVAGIVATIGHEQDHENVALQHFFPEGPLALLPLKGGHRSSIVWTLPHQRADDLVASEPSVFLEALGQCVGHGLGSLTLENTPRAWPLMMKMARTFTGPRLALVGDAAHVVHPLAGQGINLGFRDVALLAELVCDQYHLGLDPGAALLLESFQHGRRFDALTTALAMDGMSRLFSSPRLPLRLIRDFGMSVMNAWPAGKDYLAREAAGLSGTIPRLFAGGW